MMRGGKINGHPRAQRLAPEHNLGRPNRAASEEIKRRLAIGKQPAFARRAGVAAIAAVFREQNTITLARKTAEALGAITDMPAIAMEIDDDRPPSAGRQVPREQPQTIAGRQLDFPHAQCGKIIERRPRRARMIKQPALKRVEAADDAAIEYERRAEQRIEHCADYKVEAEVRSRSLRRALTLCDLSWPQAAKMSRPRGVRTGAE